MKNLWCCIKKYLELNCLQIYYVQHVVRLRDQKFIYLWLLPHVYLHYFLIHMFHLIIKVIFDLRDWINHHFIVTLPVQQEQLIWQPSWAAQPRTLSTGWTQLIPQCMVPDPSSGPLKTKKRFFFLLSPKTWKLECPCSCYLYKLFNVWAGAVT